MQQRSTGRNGTRVGAIRTLSEWCRLYPGSQGAPKHLTFDLRSMLNCIMERGLLCFEDNRLLEGVKLFKGLMSCHRVWHDITSGRVYPDV